MKIKAILTRNAQQKLSNRLPAMLAALPADDAYDIHELARRFHPLSFATLRTNLSHMEGKDRFMVRVGRDFYYGNPAAIAALKQEHYGKGK